MPAPIIFPDGSNLSEKASEFSYPRLIVCAFRKLSLIP